MRADIKTNTPLRRRGSIRKRHTPSSEPITGELLKELIKTLVASERGGRLSGLKTPSAKNLQALADAFEHIRATHKFQVGEGRVAEAITDRYVAAIENLRAAQKPFEEMEAMFLKVAHDLGPTTPDGRDMRLTIPFLRKVFFDDDEGRRQAKRRLAAVRRVAKSLEALQEHLPYFRLRLSEDTLIPASRWNDIAWDVWSLARRFIAKANPGKEPLGVSNPAGRFVQAVIKLLTGDDPAVGSVVNFLKRESRRQVGR